MGNNPALEDTVVALIILAHNRALTETDDYPWVTSKL